MDTFDDEIFGRIRNIGEFRNDIAHTSAAPSYQELLNRNDYGGTIPLGTNTQGTESTETVIMTLRERLREKEFELVDLKKDHEHLKKMHYSTVMALNALGTMTVEKKQMDKAKEIDEVVEQLVERYVSAQFYDCNMYPDETKIANEALRIVQTRKGTDENQTYTMPDVAKVRKHVRIVRNRISSKILSAYLSLLGDDTYRVKTSDLDGEVPWHQVDEIPFNHAAIIEVLKSAFYGRGSECIAFNGSQMAYAAARIEFVVRGIDLHETGRTEELQDRHDELLAYLRQTTNNWKGTPQLKVISPGVVDLGCLEFVRLEDTVFDSMIASPPKRKRRRNAN